jgi:hypothetical protein
MDSNYARLLQQQQLFLQLQILSQQQQHYSYQAILPAPIKYGQSARFPKWVGLWGLTEPELLEVGAVMSLCSVDAITLQLSRLTV